MSERKINLEEILFTETDKLRKDLPNIDLFSNEQMKESSEFKYFINAMKEACRQTLELAAENAIVESKNYFEATNEEITKGIDVYFNEIDDRPTNIHIVNKQSILDTIKQIE